MNATSFGNSATVSMVTPPKGEKSWVTVQLSKVQMFWPYLHSLPTDNKFKSEPKYGCLLVIGNQGAESYNKIAPVVMEMASKWFKKGNSPATINDLQSQFVKFSTPDPERAGWYDNQHYINVNRKQDKGRVPVVNHLAQVMSSDEVNQISNGALVNARISFGPFFQSSMVYGITGTLDAIQLIKNGTLSGGISEENVSSFFQPEAVDFGETDAEIVGGVIPF